MGDEAAPEQDHALEEPGRCEACRPRNSIFKAPRGRPAALDVCTGKNIRQKSGLMKPREILTTRNTIGQSLRRRTMIPDGSTEVADEMSYAWKSKC